MREKWTTKNIPDLSGKVFIVTGANSGIGFEAAKEFARKVAKIILACRSLDKGDEALEKIQKEISNAPVELMQLDLASLDSIKKFASEFKEKCNQLDVLVNNAGIMMTPYGKTEDGFESQVGTNHLGHFTLTSLLYDLLTRTKGARVVNVSSNGHKRIGEMDFDNFIYGEGKDYSRIKAYSRSKLANLLFTYELDKRFKKGDIDAIAVTAHPGVANTNLGNHMGVAAPVLKILLFFMVQSATKGALPIIRAAVDPEVKGSEYYGPRGRNEIRGYPIRVESNEASHNEENAKKLWELSEKLTGVKF